MSVSFRLRACSFSRHGKVETSFTLLIGLYEYVQECNQPKQNTLQNQLDLIYRTCLKSIFLLLSNDGFV